MRPFTGHSSGLQGTALKARRLLWAAFAAACSFHQLASLASADGLNFSGELRLRPEFRDNPDFQKSTKDTQSFVGSRLRIAGAGAASEDVSVKAVLQDTRDWGGEPGTAVGLTDTGEIVDIHEVYVEFHRFLKTPVTLKAGRQELNYGDQRLIGAFGWSNQGRAFDAFKAVYANDWVSADLWTAKRKENNDLVAGGSGMDRDFSGIYSTWKSFIPKGVVDFYFLLDREGDTATEAKSKRLCTVGTRIAAKTAHLDYTLEFPFQFGENGTVVGVSSSPVSVEAFAAAAKAGYTFAGENEFRAGVEYDYASGDDDPADQKFKTFSNLYPTNHPFYGYMDYQSWRNLSAWNVILSEKPWKDLWVAVSYWNLSLAEPHDGWYNAAGSSLGALRSASLTNESRSVGEEIDVLARFAQSPQVSWEAGYSHFFPGAFIKNKIPDAEGSDWAYLMATVKF